MNLKKLDNCDLAYIAGLAMEHDITHILNPIFGTNEVTGDYVRYLSEIDGELYSFIYIELHGMTIMIDGVEERFPMNQPKIIDFVRSVCQ